MIDKFIGAFIAALVSTALIFAALSFVFWDVSWVHTYPWILRLAFAANLAAALITVSKMENKL